jgi:DNA-binding GntR family transcriptional regulator
VLNTIINLPAKDRDQQDFSQKDADQLTSPETSMRESTQAWIREAILSGRYQAGEKLIERELSEMTGASRSVLREAMSHIEARGLIVRQSYRGYTVAQLSARRIFEIFELRASVETLAAELFTERASDQEVEEIGAAFRAIESGILASDLKKIRAAKDLFFTILFSGCRNTEIRRALENVIDRISYLRTQLMSDPRRRQDSLVEMRLLTEALQDRNRIEAQAASLAHLESARDALVAQLSAAAKTKVAKATARSSLKDPAKWLK